MRDLEFANDEFYHVYNHAVGGEGLVLDQEDSLRWLQSLREFNRIEPIGSMYEHTRERKRPLGKFGHRVSKFGNGEEKLVDIICYCLNPNHFHLLLKQRVDNGIEHLLHRHSMGYSKYVNNKYKRRGTLYEGRFKAKLIEDNDYLLYTSAYVNLNDRVHRIGKAGSKLVRSSWGEYKNGIKGICEKGIIMDQYKNTAEYVHFAEDSLELMLETKGEQRELKLSEVEFG
ncbi:MAG: hypothetical protein A2542_01840 [Parcubacteria group bacterium RIFOXYD2_FULL_52_8]|nr:MAG: hypothetical protein A2542_01840 [Parcubacteria group bacterium RIFOXYD2_FULL_52_8]